MLNLCSTHDPQATRVAASSRTSDTTIADKLLPASHLRVAIGPAPREATPVAHASVEGACSFILQLRVPERSVASWLQAYGCAVWMGRGDRNGGNVLGRGGLDGVHPVRYFFFANCSSATSLAVAEPPAGFTGSSRDGEGCVRDRMIPEWCTAARADGDKDAHEDEDQQEDGHVRAACRKRRGREEERDLR